MKARLIVWIVVLLSSLRATGGEYNVYSLVKQGAVLKSELIKEILVKYIDYVDYLRETDFLTPTEYESLDLSISFWDEKPYKYRIQIQGTPNMTLGFNDLTDFGIVGPQDVKLTIFDPRKVGLGLFYDISRQKVVLKDLFDFHIVHKNLTQIVLYYNENDELVKIVSYNLDEKSSEIFTHEFFERLAGPGVDIEIFD